MPHRIDARAVGVALFVEDAERPGIAPADREARRTIAAHGGSRAIFEQAFGAADILAENVRALVVSADVLPAVARQLVTVADDAADQLRMALGDPAEREERRL